MKLDDIFEKEGYPSLIRFSSLYFSKHLNSQLQLLPFHYFLANRLSEYVLGLRSKHLVINMPPRYGKSTFCIRIFISWCFSFMPWCNFIIGSNSLSLAKEHVRSVRDFLRSGWCRAFFPHAALIKKESKKNLKRRSQDENDGLSAVATSEYIYTLQGGSVKAVGLDGFITGFAAGVKDNCFGGCAICDDLLKEQDYSSLTQRNIAYEWFKSTLVSRRNSSNIPIILIMQRLHVDDIVGTLLREQSDEWDVIKIPALDEITNTSTWPETWSTEFLLSQKNSKSLLDRYLFHAKYQQEPIIDESVILPPTQWRYYASRDEAYQNTKVHFITMDTAYKAEERHDESVVQWWGVGILTVCIFWI
jgi:hypothetical protein